MDNKTALKITLAICGTVSTISCTSTPDDHGHLDEKTICEVGSTLHCNGSAVVFGIDEVNEVLKEIKEEKTPH